MVSHAMTSAELAAAGRALYGERWQSPLARALGLSDRHMRRLVAGERAITEETALAIERLLARRRADQALDEIERLSAEHGAPAEIALTEGRDEVGRRATELVAEALRARGITVTIEPVRGDLADPARRAAAAALSRRRRG